MLAHLDAAAVLAIVMLLVAMKVVGVVADWMLDLTPAGAYLDELGARLARRLRAKVDKPTRGVDD